MSSLSNNHDWDTWVSLCQIISVWGISVADVANAIDSKGIKVVDEFGRQIRATDGGKDDTNSKAYCLKCLATFYRELGDLGDCRPGTYSGDDPYRWVEYGSPLERFGWPKDEVPIYHMEFNPFRLKPTTSTVTRKDPETWILQARQYGQILYAKDMETNCPKTLAQYCQLVTEELRENRIYNTRGKILKYATVMRVALQGEGWWGQREKIRLGNSFPGKQLK
jgi:hypothetical protein